MKLTTMTQVTVDGVMQGNGGATDEDRRNGFERSLHSLEYEVETERDIERDWLASCCAPVRTTSSPAVNRGFCTVRL